MIRRQTTALLALALLALTACRDSAEGSARTSSSTAAAPGPAGSRPRPASLPELPADPREHALATSVRLLLPRGHLRRQQIDDDLSRQAFGEYLERLDGGKLFLLAEQVAALRRYDDLMDDELAKGDLELARVGGALLAQRRKVVAGLIAKLLAQPFDFTVDEETETDPKKLGYCATEAELADRWRKWLKLQVLERIDRMERLATSLAAAKGDGGKASAAAKQALAKLPKTFAEREQKARADLTASYSGRFKRLADGDPLEPVDRFLNAVAAVYGPHTAYLAPAEKENFDIEMSGSLEGIGAVLSEDDHYIMVRDIVPGGASARQGELGAGDLILSVAQQGEPPVDVADMPINDVVQMIRGPKGTVVSLTVRKPDKRVEVIDITRDVVIVEEAYARGAILEPKGPKTPAAKVGYVYLPSFYGNTRSEPGQTGDRDATSDVRKLLAELGKRRISRLIIDLRGNGGGLLEHAVGIAGLLIDQGPIVQTRSALGEREVLLDREPGVAYEGELVVLLDRASASASEILAGALQDYRRAVLVGTGETHGKGTVQTLIDLDEVNHTPARAPKLGVLKLTVQQYFRVTGESTQWRGVSPDVRLPDPAEHIESGERFLDHSIPYSETEPLRFSPWPKAGWQKAELAEHSARRLAGDPVFAQVRARSKLLKTLQAETRVPLVLDEWRRQRERTRAELDKADPDSAEREPRLTVSLLSNSATQTEPAGWRAELARDPWVHEAVQVLGDMTPQ